MSQDGGSRLQSFLMWSKIWLIFFNWLIFARVKKKMKATVCPPFSSSSCDLSIYFKKCPGLDSWRWESIRIFPHSHYMWMHVMVLSIIVYAMKHHCPKGTGHSSTYASILDTLLDSFRQFFFCASAATHETACLLRSFSNDPLKIASICLHYTVSWI